MRNYEETKSECNIYEAPKCEVIEVQNEGVLCGSAGPQATHEAFTEEIWQSSWE